MFISCLFVWRNCGRRPTCTHPSPWILCDRMSYSLQTLWSQNITQTLQVHSALISTIKTTWSCSNLLQSQPLYRLKLNISMFWFRSLSAYILLANSQGYGAPVPMYSGIPLPEMVLHGTNLMFRNVCYYTNRGTRKLLRWNHKKTPIKQY